MAFSNSFTGKGIYQPLPSGEGMQRAQESASRFILEADKLKYDTFKKNAEEFGKMMDVDPVFVISDSAMKYQSDAVAKYNEQFGGVLQKYNGNIPESVKREMATAKSYLQMDQMRLKADMEQAMAEKQMISRDTRGELDHNQWKDKWDSYMNSGKYDTTPLMPSALSPDLYFKDRTTKLLGTQGTITKTVKTPQGVLETTKSKASGTEEEARDYVKALVLGNDRFARGVSEKFEALKTNDPKKFKEYLDGSANPILQFAQDNYWEQALVMENAETEKPVTVPKNTTFDWNVSIGSGHNQNNKFNIQKSIPVALEDGTTVTLPDYMNLGQVSSTTDPQNIIEYITQDKNGKEVKTALNETARFDIVGYSPTKDVLIIKLADDTSDRTFRRGSVLMVDASRYDDLLKNKPFGIFRGETPTVAPVVKKKLVYNPKTGKLE
jgi:hypothetical protein